MTQSSPIPDPDFTGKIIKVLYDVYNELGFGYQEKYYYRAIRLKLLALGYQVQEQLLARIIIEEKSSAAIFWTS